MNQLGHEIDIMNSYQIITNLRLPHQLHTCPVARKNRTQSKKKNMRSIPHSPTSSRRDRASAALVIFIEELSSTTIANCRNLNQAYRRLDDTTLAKRYCGFEHPMLFAELGRALHREHGYHFFGAIQHCASRRFILSTSLVSSLHSYSMHLLMIPPTDSPIRLNSIDQMVTSRVLRIASSSRMGENPVWSIRVV